MFRRHHVASSVAASLALAMLVSACGADEAKTSAPAFKRDIANWRTPLDSYVPDPAREKYARTLVYNNCLEDAGYSAPHANALGAFVPPTYNSNLRYIFNVTNAQKYGYHAGPTKVAHDEDAPATAAEGQARSACAQEAAKQLHVSDDAASLVYAIKSTAYQDAVNDPGVDAARKRWRTCMLPLGIPDLPDKLSDGIMPTDSQRIRFKMSTKGADDPAAAAPMPKTAIEIKEAVFDARCQESSGYLPDLYDAEVDAQLELIKKKQDDLGRAYRTLQDSSSAIDAVIKKYAGE